ncbi:hypothetical protein GCM10008959_30780 [Deinococcus seoulensis]|uniref:Uncharacterized protein n=1 Tax=Deinococcus seoulensis TaxID=1837379 RepID=A0ABQ2RUF9_9DEIO|nr:hypothetical protein [Deinococcus seoulensis]GGR66317.1 hypothetical protein GCM10008959_30780 [Deinococcus seoulensis]
MTLFAPLPGVRQVFVLDVDPVPTSCGMAVPLMEFVQGREGLNTWASGEGEDRLREYRGRKNAVCIDGFPTGLPGTVDT